jgi:CheY-like chemotaxis protein
VKNHKGSIWVDSETGKGTTVHLLIPTLKKDTVPLSEDHTPLSSIDGHETVLVVEDEPIVMDVSREMLERLGYKVLEARTGKEAIEKVTARGENLHLVLLDVKLPDMEGGRIFEKIRTLYPDLKVIVCSGYSLDGPAREILDAGAQDFLQKPFSFEILSKKLEKVFQKNGKRL